MQREFKGPYYFDLETRRALGAAIEMAFIALRTGDCDDHVKHAIANKLIALAKDGERNPDVLCELALADICRPQMQAGVHVGGNRVQRPVRPLTFSGVDVLACFGALRLPTGK